ncbi:hypothetical protein CTAYLR_008725 [Chrysophaeum taylorii]|uniref:DH domain-containing protein n=1 Tax=Chrysophaeum taylorii TaxID=2483200 RepID=A0AAD7UMI6_9STRA|nr:hypothetical protein CTAYLR_008725 [Chrysophaeum taylorii]
MSPTPTPTPLPTPSPSTLLGNNDDDDDDDDKVAVFWLDLSLAFGLGLAVGIVAVVVSMCYASRRRKRARRSEAFAVTTQNALRDVEMCENDEGRPESFRSTLSRLVGDQTQKTAAKDEIAMICEELLATEQTYGANLAILDDLSLPDAPKRLAALLMAIGPLRKLSGELVEAFSADCTVSGVAAAFLKLAPYFKLFATYSAEYPTALLELEKYRRSSRGATALEEVAIESMLITPVQRVCKYPLFLRDLVRKLEAKGEAVDQLVDAEREVLVVAAAVNDRVRAYEGVSRTVEAYKHYDATIPELVPTRKVIDQIEVDMQHFVFMDNDRMWSSKCSSKRYRLAFFNDIVLVLRPDKLGARWHSKDVLAPNCLSVTELDPIDFNRRRQGTQSDQQQTAVCCDCCFDDAADLEHSKFLLCVSEDGHSNPRYCFLVDTPHHQTRARVVSAVLDAKRAFATFSMESERNWRHRRDTMMTLSPQRPANRGKSKEQAREGQTKNRQDDHATSNPVHRASVEVPFGRVHAFPD